MLGMIKLVANGPGIGDAMWLSAVVEEIKRQLPGERVRIETQFPTLYFGNPTITENEYINSPKMFVGLDNQENIHEHNVQFMCKQIGIQPPEWKNIRQYFYPTNDDYPAPFLEKPYITIHTTPGPWTKNKSWIFELWKELVRRIKKETNYTIVQIGGISEIRIPGIDVYLLGLELRKTCMVLIGSTRHFCCVSGSMHMASACGTQTTAIFGGREDPLVTGYFHNTNLISNISCAPCWKVEDCPIGIYINGEFIKPCMKDITANMVFNTLCTKR